MKNLFLLTALLLLVIACEKKNLPSGVSPPVHAKIEEFSRAATCSDSKVEEWSHSGNIFYLFDGGSCGADPNFPAIDTHGNEVIIKAYCLGLSCEPFEEAVYIRTVWAKRR